MTFQSRTVANTLPEINNNIFLPAIQREFVWDEKQIIRLFDSITRGYPIGSFLFWETHGDVAESQIKYKFVKNYIDEPNHPDFDYGTHHNLKVDEKFEDLPDKITFVLDGQQRLSSLYMGLKGSLTTRQKYRKRDNEESWNRKVLYLNVLNKPSESGEFDEKFQFRFKKPEPNQTSNNYWYRCGRILDFGEDVYKEIEDIVSEIRENVDGEFDESNVRENIHAFYDAIHKDDIITYFEEGTDDESKILDIFIRANEGGTQLSKSDMVLSMASSVWKEEDIGESIVAREQINQFVDKLNDHPIRGSGTFTPKFILKCLSSCNDYSVSFTYNNFGNKNKLKEMKETWIDGKFKDSILNVLDLIDEFGLKMTHIRNTRYLIPLVYYFYQNNGKPEISWASETGRKNRKRILFWLLSTCLTNAFNSKGPQLQRKIAKTIKQENNKLFPLTQIKEDYAEYGQSLEFDKEQLERDFEKYEKESNKKTQLMLYLLYYPLPANTNKKLHIDHLFPKSKLTIENLTENHDIEIEKAKEIVNKKDRIGNLQLLTENTNKSKLDKLPSKWEQKNIKYIDETTDLSLENFNQIIKKREQNMITHLTQTL